MRIHCQLQHSVLPTHSTRTPTTFIAHTHAKNGLPQCSLCSLRFFRWGNLKEHIRTGACEKLGGDAAIRYPHKSVDADPPQQQLAEAVPASSKDDSVEPVGELASQQSVMPLALRPSFRTALHQWDQQLRTAAMRKGLAQYCVLCGMWIADTKHVKQHYTTTRCTILACLTYKSKLLPSACHSKPSFAGTAVADSVASKSVHQADTASSVRCYSSFVWL